jgi:hypothetical protein
MNNEGVAHACPNVKCERSSRGLLFVSCAMGCCGVAEGGQRPAHRGEENLETAHVVRNEKISTV